MTRKILTLLLILILFSSIQFHIILAQTYGDSLKSYLNTEGIDKSYSFGFYGGIFYFIPQKTFLREVYETPFPYVGEELGMLYKLTGDFDLSVDIGSRYHSLPKKSGSVFSQENVLKEKESEKVEVVIVDGSVAPVRTESVVLYVFPLSFTCRYNILKGENYYIGIGGGVYYALLSTLLEKTNETGHSLGHYVINEPNVGFGGHGELGVQENLTKKMKLDLGLRYDFTFIGDATGGGFGNLGGFQIKLKLYIYL